APGEWSANDVLAHLRACADVWGGCIQKILAQDHPTLRAVSPRSWIRRTDYPTRDFRPSLQAYTAQRTDLLPVLCPLPQEAWSRPATVKGATRVRERTVLSYAEGMVGHEQLHLGQIAHIADALRS